jgi:fermentation-respiration switch protein FrsA (DUF1100 family)
MKPGIVSHDRWSQQRTGVRAMKVKRLLRIVLIAFASGVLIVVILLRVIENKLIYFPPRYPERFLSQQMLDREGEEVWLQTGDGVKINAIYHSDPESKQVLLWFHGNAENIGYDLDHLKALAQIGTNIMEVDYRGYGKSEGHPDEAGVYRDADAAYDYLIEQRNIRSRDIIIYGHSLGGAVAVDLASRRPCGALIVESSFTSAAAIAHRMFPLPFIAYVIKSRFDSEKKIGEVRAPILIVHGTQDEVIPFTMGQQLFAASREPKRFCPIEGAGHNDLLEVGGDAYVAWLKGFVVESAR